VTKTPASTDERRTALLEAAFATFIRFGYRKTSMDDVAREVEISRQALYAYFADKEALFRACMKHGFDKALAEVDRALDGDETSIHERLVLAIDAWIGRHLEKSGADGSDLGEMARVLLGTFFEDYGAAFERKLARAIADSPIAAAVKEARATPLQLAQMLRACAYGWKYRVASRAEFVAQMELAVRLLTPKLEEKGSARKRGNR
jgi:AcrR family transcriptional regulator